MQQYNKEMSGGNTELADRLNESLRKYREDAAYYQMKNMYFGKLM